MAPKASDEPKEPEDEPITDEGSEDDAEESALDDEESDGSLQPPPLEPPPERSLLELHDWLDDELESARFGAVTERRAVRGDGLPELNELESLLPPPPTSALVPVLNLACTPYAALMPS